MDEKGTYTPNPWALPEDTEAMDAAECFISRYEIQKVNHDVNMSGKDWLQEGFLAGVDWARHTNKSGTKTIPTSE